MRNRFENFSKPSDSRRQRYRPRPLFLEPIFHRDRSRQCNRHRDRFRHCGKLFAKRAASAQSFCTRVRWGRPENGCARKVFQLRLKQARSRERLSVSKRRHCQSRRRLDQQRQTSKSAPFSAQQQDCATRSFFAKFLDRREVCSLLISLEALELRRRRRSFTIRLAGVAELADALDSKSSDRKIVWVRAPPPASSSTASDCDASPQVQVEHSGS